MARLCRPRTLGPEHSDVHIGWLVALLSALSDEPGHDTDAQQHDPDCHEPANAERHAGQATRSAGDEQRSSVGEPWIWTTH
jgi:hypothetical protein